MDIRASNPSEPTQPRGGHPQGSPPAPLELGSTWSEASPPPEMKQGLGDRRLGWWVMPCSGWDMGMTSPAPGEGVAPGTTGQPQSWLVGTRAWGQSWGGERLILAGSGNMEALRGGSSATRSLSDEGHLRNHSRETFTPGAPGSSGLSSLPAASP